MSQETESQWNSEKGYIWSMLGTAIGFANLLGFGSQCYRNGGGAFLIPFLVALFVLGIPMLILEGIIGNSSKLPLVSAYGRVIGRRGKVLGWLAVAAVTTIGAFYAVLTGWAIAYTGFASMGVIPADTAGFFKDSFLHATGSLENMGVVAIPALMATSVVGMLGWWIISKNIQSGIERCCSVFLPVLTVLVIIFGIAVALLPGAADGFINYLRPDFERLGDFRIWRDVFGQLFFSLSLGLGIVVGYSRHSDSKTRISRAMLSVALADFVVSFVSGAIIFGCLGYMAQQQGVAFSDVASVTSDFEIGYVIFPMIINTFGPILSRVLGALFFFSVFIAGFTGIFSIVESVAGNIEVEFSATRRRAVTIAMGMITMLAIPFCFGSGTALIDALEPMVLGNNMLIGGIAQIIVFMFLAKDYRDHPVWWKGSRRSLAYYSIRYAALTILVVSLASSINAEFSEPWTRASAIRWGWLAIALAMATGLSRCGLKEQPSSDVAQEGSIAI